MPPSQRTVCLYCGSRKGTNPAHLRAARALGEALARGGYALVYGAGDRGLMGEAARAAQEAGARITGFIPRHLMDVEAGKQDLHATIVTDTMHERKKLMLTNAEGVIALAGGPGTLDELVEVLTWRGLGLHRKPVFLLNTEGYWDPLVNLFRHMTEQGFVGEQFLGYLTVAETVEDLVAALRRALP